jgi:hypothetical protein
MPLSKIVTQMASIPHFDIVLTQSRTILFIYVFTRLLPVSRGGNTSSKEGGIFVLFTFLSPKPSMLPGMSESSMHIAIF